MKTGKVVSIARREYIARVRSKAFLFTTLMIPGLMVLSAVLFPLLLSRADVDVLDVVVVDAGTGLGDALTARLNGIERVPFAARPTETVSAADIETTRGRFLEAVRNDELDGYVVLLPDDNSLARGQYYAGETGNLLIISALESALETTILENWFVGEQLDRIRAAQRASLETITVSASGEERGGFLIAYVSTMILGMLLYITVLLHGQQMALAIVEEKSSRLVELIIGAVTSSEYMLGKILGVLGAGMTQLGIWLAMVAVTILGILPGLAIDTAAAELDLANVLDAGTLAYFTIFFFLGYLMYATIFAAVGATCDNVQELQQAATMATMPVVFAFMSTFYIMTNPNSFAAEVLSLFPLFTPLTMFARVNVAEPPLWQVWLGILLLAGTSALTIWGASKVFRATILFHGKRPSLRELMRMVQAS